MRGYSGLLPSALPRKHLFPFFFCYTERKTTFEIFSGLVPYVIAIAVSFIFTIMRSIVCVVKYI